MGFFLLGGFLSPKRQRNINDRVNGMTCSPLNNTDGC